MTVVRHLSVAAPFNLEATIRLLQRRPANRIDRWEDGRYLRAVQTRAGLRLLAVENQGTIDAPDVRLAIQGGPVSESVGQEVAALARWICGLDAEPAPVAWLAELEPRLADVAAAVRGFRAPCYPSLFETGASVIPFQQVSLDAGIAITGRLAERLGPALTIDAREFIAFPEPATIAGASTDLLRAVGLSRTKVASLQALADRALAGELERARFQPLASDAAMAELRRLPGIGPWSAGLMLLRGLRRVDVFPAGDVGAARNLAALLGLAEPIGPAEASAFAARFGDRQGYLYFLALAGQLLARGIIQTT